MTTNLSTDLKPGTYLVDPARSTCRLVATHAFGLKPVAATVAITGGTVTLTAVPGRCTASASLAAASFQSDDPRRDRDITGRRFLDAARHPEIAFRSTGCEGRRMTGVLSVRGTESPVSLEITDWEPVPEGYRASVTTEIDRVAAGIRAGRGLIARTVRITLDVLICGRPAG